MAKAAAKLSPFRLTSVLRQTPNPNLALQIFRNPNPSSSPKPFRRSARSYDLIICKLGRARMFTEMEKILHQMALETRFTPKEALFSRAIAFYGRAGDPAAALRLFRRIPDPLRTVRSFNSLLHALVASGDHETIKDLCRDLEIEPDACTYNILIRATAISGSLGNARDLFDEMLRRGLKPTVFTFGALITALCAESKADEAIQLKTQMLSFYKVTPNAHIYTSIIKALCDRGELDRALELKDELRAESDAELDSAVYSTLIRALFRARRKGEVVALLEEMKGIGVRQDNVTYNAMIAGFCDENDFEAALEALNEIGKKGLKVDVVAFNTMIAGFCREGRWRDAGELLDEMPRRECRPDGVSYRTLFGGICDAGEFREAGSVLDEMVFRGFRPGVSNVRKFVEGLCGRGDEGFAGEALCRLAEGGGGASDGWSIVVGRLLRESESSKARELVDYLKIG